MIFRNKLNRIENYSIVTEISFSEIRQFYNVELNHLICWFRGTLKVFSFCCFVFAKKHPRKCCFGWQLLHLAFKWDWVNISSAGNSEWGNYWAFSCELEGWLWADWWWMAKQLQCFLFFVIKQLVHTSAVHSLGYKALGKFREQSRS